jgi:hypothetical protein
LDLELAAAARIGRTALRDVAIIDYIARELLPEGLRPVIEAEIAAHSRLIAPAGAVGSGRSIQPGRRVRMCEDRDEQQQCRRQHQQKKAGFPVFHF